MNEELYRSMVRIRVVEEGIASHYKDQEMRCPVHLSIGQEATAVGVCSHLNKNDWVFSTHRSHAHYLAKGGDLRSMLAELHGKETGCCHGRGGSMHLVDKGVNFYAVPIVASAIPIAVGVAKAIRQRKSDEVVVCFFGDAAIESGQFWEAFNLAHLWSLSILFVMEDNGLSVSTPKEDRCLFNRAVTAAMTKTYLLDGMNVESVYRNAQSALTTVRCNQMPVVLVCKVERYAEHCGPGDSPDPCDRTNDWELKLFCGVQYDRAMMTAMREFQEALAFAKTSPFPKSSTMLDEVFA